MISFFFLSNTRFDIMFIRIFCHFKLHVLCLILLLFLWIDPPKDNGGASISKYIVEMAEGSNGKNKRIICKLTKQGNHGLL